MRLHLTRSVARRFNVSLAWAGLFLVASVASAATVDFQDLTPTTPYTGPGGGGYWKGPVTTNGYDEPDTWGGTRHVGTFSSGAGKFVNRYNTDYGSWSGFAYSNTADTTTGSFANQFSAFARSGVTSGRNTYAIGYGYVDVTNPYTGEALFDPQNLNDLAQLPSLMLPTGANVESVSVANTTYTALSMQRGDAFTKKFGGASGNDPDWFKLSVYGVNASGTPLENCVELYLADFRFANNALDYILDDWTFLDLSSLAGATSLYFNLSSSDVGDWGMNTPSYFALDNLSFTLASEPAAVPEPASLAILLGGGLVLGSVGWLRRRTARQLAA